MSKIKSVAFCGQFSQGVPENPGQTSVAKFVVNLFLHLSTYLHKVSYTGVAGQQRDNSEVPCHPFNAILSPKGDLPWTNAGMRSNLPVNGTIECDASITVWCCWSCARCEESLYLRVCYGHNDSVQEETSPFQHATPTRKVENTMSVKTC